MKKDSSINSILEIFWLIVSIFTLLMGFYSLVTQGFKASYMFFIMALLTFGLYLARRGLRRKNTNNE